MTSLVRAGQRGQAPSLGLVRLDRTASAARYSAGDAASVVAPLCAEFRRWSFLCVIAPLRLAVATGSPVNPIAIL